MSQLRLINLSQEANDVKISGVDDHGVSFNNGVRVSLPANAARTVTAQELESGNANLEGMLGDGSGKWQLLVESEKPILSVSLLESPSRHWTNLSNSYYPIQDVSPPVQLAVYIPDTNLRNVIERTLGKAQGEVLTRSEIATITELDGNNKGIVDLTGLRFAEGLTSLNLDNNEIGDISPLSGLKNLTWLHLYNNKITDISPLSELTNLTLLWLLVNDITDISPLSGLTKLTTLRLDSNEITDITALSRLTKLTYLVLNFNEIADISPLSGLTSLSSLGLTGNDAVDISLLSGLNDLRSLWLQSMKIADISPLSALTNLTALRLDYNEIVDISAISGLTKLTTLRLGNNEIRDLSPLSRLTDLSTLWLDNNEIEDISPLSSLTNLTSLRLNNGKIADLSPISGLVSLVELHVQGNQIEEITALSMLTNLEILDLGRNRIEDIGSLEHLVNLAELYLSRNQIRDTSPLANNYGLGDGDYIGLRANPLSDTSVNEHTQALLDRGVDLEFSRPPKLLSVFNDNVVVMQIDESVAQDSASTGMPFDVYAWTFYNWFEDKFDFLMFFSNLNAIEDHHAAGYYGIYLGVWNETKGLGLRQYFNRAYGSAKRLRGVLHFPYNRALLWGPSLHELLHAWANFSVPTATAAHWGFSSAHGQLGGFAMENLVDLGDGRYAAGSFGAFANGGNGVPYSPIELYFAGFIPPEEVPDLWVASDGKWLNDEDGNRVRTDDEQFVFVAESVNIVANTDIVAEHGARHPSSAEAPWHHRIAVVLLTDEDHPATEEQLQLLSEHADSFSYRGVDDDHSRYNYYEATGGRGSITMDGLAPLRKNEPSPPSYLPESFGEPPPSFYSTNHGRCLPFRAPSDVGQATEKHLTPRATSLFRLHKDR